VLVGSARLLREAGVTAPALEAEADRMAEGGATPVFCAVDGEPAAAFAIGDAPRAGAAEAVAALKARGLRVAMITGDRRATAQAVAAALGIDTVRAEVLPTEKADAVAALQADGAKVAFIGDGINDAPALARADVGVAIGAGTDVAIESADMVLISEDLGRVADAVGLSQATMTNIRQNLGWAFGYNLALIPVAAGALWPAFGLLLSPMFAGLAMALSSVSVVTNALRLRRMRLR
jgi:P-type E1-E2 ATPase